MNENDKRHFPLRATLEVNPLDAYTDSGKYPTFNIYCLKRAREKKILELERNFLNY